MINPWNSFVMKKNIISEGEHLLKLFDVDINPWKILNILKTVNFWKNCVKGSIHSSFVARYETAEGEFLAFYACIWEVRTIGFQILMFLVERSRSYMKNHIEKRKKEWSKEVFYSDIKVALRKQTIFIAQSCLISFPFFWGFLFEQVEGWSVYP